MATYTYTTINPPGSTYTYINGINNRGQVVGDSSVYGFIYDHGSYTIINVPGTPETLTSGFSGVINDLGQAVGIYYSQISEFYFEGFLYSGGTYSTIDPPGSISSNPGGINDLGQIVGTYEDDNFHWHGFLYSSGKYITIDAIGSIYTYVSGINDSGQMVGSYEDSSSHFHGYLLKSAKSSFHPPHYTTIDPPNSIDTYIYAINASGQIVGYYNDGHQDHGFLYSHGNYTTIDPPGSTNSYVSAINASGQIVGYYWDNNNQSHGFIYTDGSYIIVDLQGNPAVTWMNGINDSGQIVGFYDPGGNDLEGFLPPVMLDAVTSSGHRTRLSGTGAANSIVSVFDDGTLIGTATAGSDGTWKLPTRVNTKVVHEFSETYTDQSGNVVSSPGITLWAPTGHLTLTGTNGDDVLIGANGNMLTGGGGYDTFVFNRGFGKDTITDFNINHDVLRFDQTPFLTATQVIKHTHDSPAGAVIVLDSKDTVTLAGVTVAQLQEHLNDLTFNAPLTLTSPLSNIHSANVALLGNYMATSFVSAAHGHGGTLISEAAQTANQLMPLTTPHTG
jgi:probable HAF family extracellular repeat protein